MLSHVPKLLILFKSMVLDPRRNAVYCLVNHEGFALGLLGLSPGVGIAYTRGKRGENWGELGGLQKTCKGKAWEYAKVSILFAIA